MWLELLQTQSGGKSRTSTIPRTSKKSLKQPSRKLSLLTVAKQPPPTQALLPPSEATKEPTKAGDQGSGVEVAKGKEAG